MSIPRRSLLGALLACGVFYLACTGDDPVLSGVSGGDDAGIEGGASGDTGVADAARTCATGCGGCILYVSNGGNDGNDGCTPATPRRTIVSAIVTVKTDHLVDHEIEVCNGMYAEKVAIDFAPVRVLGGFDCATWKREPLDPRSNPAGMHTQILAPVTGALSVVGFSSSAVTKDVLFEGFHVTGAATPTDSTTAIGVVGGATPTLHANLIEGGDATVGVSTGLAIESSSPDVYENRIAGGVAEGKGASAAYSVGIAISSAGSGPTKPHIHDNTVDGGKATVSTSTIPAASVGVAILGTASSDIALTGANAFEKNFVSGGTGSTNTGPGPRDYVTVGLLVVSAKADVLDNVILGGVAANGGRGQVGVVVQSGGVDLERNRIFGGERSTAIADQADATIGVSLQSSAYTDVVEVTNNLIHAGIGSNHTPAVGIEVRPLGKPGAAVIRNNVVFATANGAMAHNVYLGDGASTTHLLNNLFPSAQVEGTGVGAFECLSVTNGLATLSNNAFFEKDALVRSAILLDGSPSGVGACAGSPSIDPPALTANGWTGNVRVSVSATACTGCILSKCGITVDSCLGGIFEAWTLPNGKAELLGAGWKIKRPGVPCALATGGTNVLPAGLTLHPATTDFFGAMRTGTVSIGAEEVDSTCAP